MATPSADNIYRSPGLLVASPTGSDPSNSYGGTVLGSVTGVMFDPGVRYEPIMYDELGKAGEVLAIHDEPMLYATMRGWDNDILSRVFPSFSSITGVATLGGDLVKLAAAKGIPLLYAPFDPAAPAVYMLNAVPMMETSEMGLKLSIMREMNLSLVFLALPASSSSNTSGKVGPVAAVLA